MGNAIVVSAPQEVGIRMGSDLALFIIFWFLEIGLTLQSIPTSYSAATEC